MSTAAGPDSPRSWCAPCKDGLRLAVQITPNARKTEVIGVLGDALKLKLQAQPIEGKANEALIRYLSDVLGVPRSAITITHGQSNKRKLVEVKAALSMAEVERRLAPPAG